MQKSAGILLFRTLNKNIQVFLVHPGGPFWKNKDLGAWSIPKGEFDEHEDPLDTAKREFKEETGTLVSGDFLKLSPVKQKSGKWVYAWAVMGNLDPATLRSNFTKIQWPPKSGKWQTIPEVDKGEWFDLKTAKLKINPAQAVLIDELTEMLSDEK
jgi:predicted NUDIX family NTP pyrophosphohydrolase